MATPAADANICVACGLVLRPTTTRCPTCATDVVAGAVRRESVPLDVLAVLVDQRRQRTTRALVEVAAVLLAAAFVLSLGTAATWGVASAAAYVLVAWSTAPKPLQDAWRAPEGRRRQEVLRQDIATGPPRATTGGRAFEIEVTDVVPGYLFTGLAMCFGVFLPLATLAATDEVQGKVAGAMAVIASVLAWAVRSRRETDAAGFRSHGVPID